MKPRTIIGLFFIVVGLLKLGTITRIIHWQWFETMTEGRWSMYFCIFLIICVGAHLIVDSYRRDPDQWLQRPLPIGEDGKRKTSRTPHFSPALENVFGPLYTEHKKELGLDLHQGFAVLSVKDGQLHPRETEEGAITDAGRNHDGD